MKRKCNQCSVLNAVAEVFNDIIVGVDLSVFNNSHADIDIGMDWEEWRDDSSFQDL